MCADSAEPVSYLVLNGRSSRWYRAAQQQRAGRIAAAGMRKDVHFEPVHGPINNRIDDA
jgi:hypothetical protein